MKKETESAKRNSKNRPVEQVETVSGQFEAMQLLEPASSKAVALIIAMDEALCNAARNSDDVTLRRTANGMSYLGMHVVKELEASFEKCHAFKGHLSPGAVG